MTAGARWRMAVLKDQQLRMINVDRRRQSSPGGAIVTDQGRLRVAVESPFDGRLYVLTDSGNGSIVQITPVI